MLLRIKIWEKMPSIQSRKSQGINLLTLQKGSKARLSPLCRRSGLECLPEMLLVLGGLGCPSDSLTCPRDGGDPLAGHSLRSRMNAGHAAPKSERTDPGGQEG